MPTSQPAINPFPPPLLQKIIFNKNNVIDGITFTKTSVNRVRYNRRTTSQAGENERGKKKWKIS